MWKRNPTEIGCMVGVMAEIPLTFNTLEIVRKALVSGVRTYHITDRGEAEELMDSTVCVRAILESRTAQEFETAVGPDEKVACFISVANTIVENINKRKSPYAYETVDDQGPTDAADAYISAEKKLQSFGISSDLIKVGFVLIDG